MHIARRVGILVDGFAELAGASDFLTSLVDAMCRAADGRDLVLIMRLPSPRWSPAGIAASVVKLMKDTVKRQRPTLPPKSVDSQEVIDRLVGEGLRRLPLYTVENSPRALAALCEQEGIDVVMPPHYALRGYRLPWVGYIFDFQHRYYPHFFTQRILRHRDRQFDDTLTIATTVIVNARQVKADAERFHATTARIIPLPFSAAPDLRWLETDPVEVRKRYGIGPRYFLISNQFWVHKRHEVAIEAFLNLAQRHDDIELVCTGSTDDWRAPDHFPKLRAMIADSATADRVHILGLIPKLDQIALLRGCMAIVQPTAFEGGPGGGSVFDAVALGVRALVSDLPVNREIEQDVTAFFPLDDVAALTIQMQRIVDIPRPPMANAEKLIRLGNDRRMAMGKALWDAADHAVVAHARNKTH